MSYLVVDTDGHLHHRNQVPNSAAVNREVGEPGWAMVYTGGPYRRVSRAMGWVNDCGHLDGLPRNVVGSCLLAAVGASVMPYAGPVVVTGWHPDREIVALTGEQRAAMELMHSDIRRLLGLDGGEVSDQAPARWRQAMVRVAEIVVTAPTPTAVVLGPGDPGWPL